ncbi:unnamed protein product [Heligmosomoides polygyrus]|uniref:Secreted protein n=1 Tax=Heligmosomoides polygyrus TaxID=6339 RepID=A0A183GU11_HELPZ|nr:unnamed protein product [Heligmosomoides polygyrus]
MTLFVSLFVSLERGVSIEPLWHATGTNGDAAGARSSKSMINGTTGDTGLKAMPPMCSAGVQLAMHGCRRVRHVSGSPCTVADVFGTSTASPGTSMFNNRFQYAVLPLQL